MRLWFYMVCHIPFTFLFLHTDVIANFLTHIDLIPPSFSLSSCTWELPRVPQTVTTAPLAAPPTGVGMGEMDESLL